jgi:serine/threonine-protein kinase
MVVSTGRPRVPLIAAGTTVAAATSLIQAAGLRTTTDSVRNVFDDTVISGAVVRTDPAAGDPVDIGSTVTLICSRGPAPVQVPAVSGKQIEDARNALLVAGFSIGTPVSQFDADVPAGTVIGTQPQEGDTAPHGSSVSLVLATSLTVPDVSGLDPHTAFADLSGQGFVPTLGDPAFDPAIPGGQVIGTEPVAGTRIDPAVPAVTVVVSTAVTVPDLTRGSVSDAKNAASGLGLQIDVHALFGMGASRVTGQNPAAGTLVAPGSTVSISAWP